MVNLWTWLGESAKYLLYGPSASTPASRLLAPPAPPIRTSLVFDSHVMTEASGGRGGGKNPQTVSSAWDERDRWGDQAARTWQGLTPQDRKAIMLDIYLNIPAASSCVDVIAKRIFSGGVVVEKVDEEGPDNQQHYDQLMEFVLRINPDWDFMQLGRSLVTDKLIFGECYSEILWKGGLPWNLIKVDCIPMGYRANKWGQIEQFYQLESSSNKKNFLDPKDIIRWWFPHPRASIDPFAPVEKVSDAVLIDKKMMMWMITFFQKGAKFPYYVKFPGGQDEAERYIAYFRQNHTGEKNAHIPPVAYDGAEFVPFQRGSLEMDFEKGMDRMDTIIYGAYGVPPAAVSVIKVGALGGNSGEDQDKSLIFNACDPVKQAFFEKLNDRITKRGFNIHDYRLTSHYADYRSDENVSKVEDTRVRNGTRTIDEIRAESGKRPYKVGGNVAVIVTTKEITPVPRLGDIEDEQRQTAQVTLATAQANADLAATKAKQAKEPPKPVPAPLQQSGQDGNAPPYTGKNAGNAGNAQQDKKQAKEDDSQRPAILQQHTGVMVAFMLNPETARNLSLPGGEPIKDLHCTLAFLGDMYDEIRPGWLHPVETVDHLKAVLLAFTSGALPLLGKVGGIGRFVNANNDVTPIIAPVNVPGLQEWRRRLVSMLELEGYHVANDFDFLPHITLAYIPDDAPMPIDTIGDIYLKFDTLCLAIGDDRYFFPLLGQQTESTPAPTTKATLADQLHDLFALVVARAEPLLMRGADPLHAYALTPEMMTTMTTLLANGYLTAKEAAYQRVATAVQAQCVLEPWHPHASDDVQAHHWAADQVASIAHTYQGQLGDFLPSLSMEGVPGSDGLTEGVGTAVKGIIEKITGWIKGFLGPKIEQIVNVVQGTGDNDGTDQAAADVLDQATSPNVSGTAMTELRVRVVPAESSGDLCKQYAGHDFALSEIETIPDFPIHPNCPHRKEVYLVGGENSD